MSYTVIAQDGSEPTEFEAPTVHDALDYAMRYDDEEVTILSASGWRLSRDELEALAKA